MTHEIHVYLHGRRKTRDAESSFEKLLTMIRSRKSLLAKNKTALAATPSDERMRKRNVEVLTRWLVEAENLINAPDAKIREFLSKPL
jgi:hypothetical protein